MTINVTNISPTPGTKLATGAALSFDVTTDGEAYVIQIVFGNSSYELAFDGEGYPVPYASSSRQAISGGHSYTIRRSGSWPGAPVLAVRPLASGGVQSEIQGTTVEVGTDGAETVSVGTAATSALDLSGASLAAAVTGNVIVESTGGDATLGADGDVSLTVGTGRAVKLQESGADVCEFTLDADGACSQTWAAGIESATIASTAPLNLSSEGAVSVAAGTDVSILAVDSNVGIAASNGAVTITAPDIVLTGGVSANGVPIGDPPIVKHTTSGTLTARAINILSGTATSMTMPAQSGWAGGALVVKKANLSGDVTITRSGSDTIDGATTYTLTGSYGCASFVADDSTAVIYAAPGLS